MKKAWLIMLVTGMANAQYSTYYTDQLGQPAGQAWTYGNQTFYSSEIGRPTGSSATNTDQPPPALSMPYPIQPEPVQRFEALPPLGLPRLPSLP